MAIFLTPDPNRTIADFPSVELMSASISTNTKRDAKGSDYSELWIRHEDGREFFYRDPAPETIERLRASIPSNVGLRLVYSPTHEGNVLMDIAALGLSGERVKFLDFEKVKEEYARRRRTVYLVAAVWFVLGTILMLLGRTAARVP